MAPLRMGLKSQKSRVGRNSAVRKISNMPYVILPLTLDSNVLEAYI